MYFSSLTLPDSQVSRNIEISSQSPAVFYRLWNTIGLAAGHAEARCSLYESDRCHRLLSWIGPSNEHRLPEDDVSWDYYYTLSTSASRASKRELASGASGTLPHALQSEVSVLPPIRDSRVNAC